MASGGKRGGDPDALRRCGHTLNDGLLQRGLGPLSADAPKTGRSPSRHFKLDLKNSTVRRQASWAACSS